MTVLRVAIGVRFGRLVVLAAAPRRPAKTPGARSLAQWQCRCDCGTELVTTGHLLCVGKKQSCGCLHRDVTIARNLTHGDSIGNQAPEYRSWRGMVGRCEQPAHKSYERYGGRGIKVCPRWRESYEAFLADMGRKPSPQHSLERLNNDGDYEPTNVVWGTPVQQARNRLGTHWVFYRGRKMCLAEACSLTGVNRGTALSRLDRGLPVEMALRP